MTSMPASRSARAMTFAPRSCPSRPGLATKTRILRWETAAVGNDATSYWTGFSRRLQNLDLIVFAKDGPQLVHDLAQGGVGPHRLQDGRHQVFGARGRLPHPGQGRPHPAGVPLPPHPGQALPLLGFDFRPDLQDGDRRLLVDGVGVDADDDLLARLDAALVFVGR